MPTPTLGGTAPRPDFEKLARRWTVCQLRPVISSNKCSGSEKQAFQAHTQSWRSLVGCSIMPSKVAFARVNRRADEHLGALQPFKEDMEALALSRQTRSLERVREWIAADMKLDPSGDWLTGLIGFREPEARRQFEEDAYSWLKAPVTVAEDASQRNIVPFAIDLREDRRWVGHAVSGKVTASTFAGGLERALNAAIAATGLMPAEWNVDPITSRTTVEEWVREHPDIRVFTRSVKIPNPVDDLSDEIEEMRQLAARNKKEQFTAGYDQNLRVAEVDGSLTELAREKLEGLEEGYIDIYFEARGPGQKYTFDSRRKVDWVYVDDYGADLDLGVELVLAAVRTYSDQRARGDTESTRLFSGS